MPKLVTYRCPDCKGNFDFLHHPTDEPPPERCELCGSYMGDEPQKAPVLRLNFGKEKNKVPDQVYRRMESASVARAEEAAELTGATAAEMSGMKMTNMRDNLREGDVTNISTADAALKRLSTPTAAPVMQNPTGGMPVQPNQISPEAQAWISETTSGPNALSARNVIQSMPHRELQARVTAAGNDGKRY